MQRGSECADPLDPVDQPFGLQLPQRSVDGHAADPDPLHQLTLGRHQLARKPSAARQFMAQVSLDLLKRGRTGAFFQ